MNHSSFKCLKCNTIVTGDGKGNCITCECGDLYVDETKYYCRLGFSDANLVLDVEKNKTLAEIQKEQETNENKN